MVDKQQTQEKQPDCSIIKELIKQYPNDMDLGAIIRQIFNKR